MQIRNFHYYIESDFICTLMKYQLLCLEFRIENNVLLIQLTNNYLCIYVCALENIYEINAKDDCKS